MIQFKIIFISLLSHYFVSQKSIEIVSYFENISNLNFFESQKIAKDLSNPIQSKLVLLTKIIEDDRQTNLKDLDTKFLSFTINKEDDFINKYVSHLILGYKYLNYEKNKVLSFKNFQKAYELALSKKNQKLQKYSLYFLLVFSAKGVLQSNQKYKDYLTLYKELCENETDWLHYYSFQFNLLSQTETYNEKNSSLKTGYEKIFISYDSLIENSKKLNNKIKSIYYKDKANLIIRDNPELAKVFYEKALNSYTESNYYKFEKFYYHINLARVYSLKKEYKNGLKYLNKAKKYISYNDSLFDSYDINAFKALMFQNLKQFDSAYFYEKKVRFLGYKINFQKENQKVSELIVELETEKKEKENLELKQQNQQIDAKRKQNLLLLLVVTLLLILGSVIYILSYQNTKRKQKLIEQEKELEKQKNLTLLKEQEITTINAMIEGQEKERLRISEDLHDNIGSVLATLKLHFENLKLNREKKQFNQEELYNRTEKLIDETYLKVRKIAHAKNAGVIANQGLLNAVKLMADKISSADKIQIEVTDFGLEKRLENNIEIMIFRIIQELITNVVKHANATFASINISQYQNNLNIIIEDNGIGFNTKKIMNIDGMGLTSIKKRVKHYNGSIKIDSTQGKGTTIIIDLPI